MFGNQHGEVVTFNLTPHDAYIAIRGCSAARWSLYRAEPTDDGMYLRGLGQHVGMQQLYKRADADHTAHEVNRTSSPV